MNVVDKKTRDDELKQCTFAVRKQRQPSLLPQHGKEGHTNVDGTVGVDVETGTSLFFDAAKLASCYMYL